MARHVGIATDVWTSAAAWNQITNTPTIHASTNINISTTNLFTATFTAPNTTNACTGVALYLATANTSGGDITITLQESGVDTAATVTVASSLFTNSQTWIYFRFASPYTFTTTGAGAYRFKVVNSSASNVPIGAADSGGGNLAYLATDDRAAVPASTDDVWILGNNGANSITVTMDGTQSIGATGTATTTSRSVTAAVMIGERGKLSWDTAASASLTCLGAYIVAMGGTWEVGTTGTPYPSGRIAQLLMNQNGSSNTYAVTTFGTVTLQGTPKSSTSLWKTKYASGTGTAASPLVVADAVDWSVDDEILVGSTSGRTETEYRFIITKNSSTSYVISSTQGGAEAALANTHTTDAWIVNLTRNIIIKPTAANVTFQCTLSSGSGLGSTPQAGDVNIDWVRWEQTGTFGVNLSAGTASNCSCDYSVSYNHDVGWFWNQSTGEVTYTGLVTCKGENLGSARNGFFVGSSSGVSDKTLVDCFAFDQTGGNGWNSLSMTNMTFTRCYGIGLNHSNAGNFTALSATSMFACTFDTCEFHASGNGFRVSGSSGSKFIDCLFGTKGTNGTDVVSQTSYNDVTFESCTFGSATFVSSYTNLTPGAELRFHKLSGTENNHIWYTRYGTARSTGTGLVDTTVRTAGSLGVRLAPENNSTGFYWDFQILAPASSIVSFFCYSQKNVAFGTSTAKFELFLPGSIPGVDVADDSYTLPNTTGSWLPVSLSANYSGTADGLATIRVTGITSTSAAYLYVDDLFNADDSTAMKLAALDVWRDGKPSQIIAPQAVSAADVWTFSTADLTTANTTGKKLVDGLIKGQFLGLK